MKTFEEIYYSASVAECKYFKKVWLQVNKRSARQFKNRLKNPTSDDLGLFCQVCKVPPALVLSPSIDKFKNIAPFATNLQMTIEP